MKKITLTAGDETLTGSLPESWADVPLAAYAQLCAPHERLADALRALAAICQLPEDCLLGSVAEVPTLLRSAPWLFGSDLLPASPWIAGGDSLPAATGPVAYFTHAGVTYRHVGNLQELTAGQLEALYTFNAGAANHPLSAAPSVLAILYCAEGKEQTARVVEQAAQAFASLPMSIAWPAIAAFMESSGPAALNIQTASALHAQASELLSKLEQTMATAGDSSTFWQKPRQFLFRTWLRNVRKML